MSETASVIGADTTTPAAPSRRIGLFESWRLLGFRFRRADRLALGTVVWLLQRPASERLQRRLTAVLTKELATLETQVSNQTNRVPPSLVRSVMIQLHAIPSSTLQQLDMPAVGRLARYGLRGDEMLHLGTTLRSLPACSELGDDLCALATAERGSPLLAFVDLEIDGSRRVVEAAVVLRSCGRKVAVAEFTAGETTLLSDWLRDSLPVAHNGEAHDFPILGAAGVDLPSERLDTLLWAQIAWPTADSHALPTLAHFARVEASERHRAVADAEVLADSFDALVTTCRSLSSSDRAGVHASLSGCVPSAVLALMLGTVPDGALNLQSPLVSPSTRPASTRTQPVVAMASSLSADHLQRESVVAGPDHRALHSSGLTRGWLLRGDRVIDANALGSGLASRGWPGAIAIRVLTEADGAVCMWPKASASMSGHVPVADGAVVCTGPGPWLTDLESLPTVAAGRHVVLEDAVAVLLDTTGRFDPATHDGPLTLRVDHSGHREIAIARWWQQVLGDSPSFEGTEPSIRWSTKLVTGLASSSSPGARVARTAAIAAQQSVVESTMLVTNSEQHAFVANVMAAPWRQRTGTSLLRPGDWPTYAETVERLRRDRHLVVAATTGAPRVAAHVTFLVIDEIGTPRLDGTVISRLLQTTNETGDDPYGDVIEPAAALRLMRLLSHGSGNALLCDRRCDNPMVRRLLSPRGTWSSQHISTLEAGDISAFAHGVLTAALPSTGEGSSLEPAIQHAVQRLLGEGGAARPFQSIVLQSLAAGRDVLAVFRTGQGKSLCYQAFGLALAEAGFGTTLVVSPLIALQRDQVEGLRRRAVWEATSVSGDLHPDVRQARLRGIASGFYRLVYVAPEGLMGLGLRKAVGEAGLAGVAVDEAHCISEMGHDFRPDYRTLPISIRRLMGLRDDTPLASVAFRPRLMAFTGTASPSVREDIAVQLEGAFVQHVDSQFVRPELRFRLVRVPDEVQRRQSTDIETQAERLRLLEATLDQTQLPAIVYTATRHEADQLATHLASARGVATVAYHGDMKDDARRAAEEAFRCDEASIICATNAFGMGVDKANVRTVIHWRMPGSPEALYQEAGRAGRGPEGQPADCIVLFHPSDLDLAARIRNRSVPTRAELEAVWATLVEFENLQPGAGVVWSNDEDLATLIGLRAAVPVSVCLAYLSRAGLVRELERTGSSERVRRALGPTPTDLTPVEAALLAHLTERPWSQVAQLFAELVPSLNAAGEEVDLPGLEAALRSVRGRGLVETAPAGALLRPLRADPGEAVREHLLLCHRILTVALQRDGKWTEVTAERASAVLPKAIAAVETLAAFGFVAVSAAHSVASPPSILPRAHSRVALESLGRLARPVMATAVPLGGVDNRCVYTSVATSVGCEPADVRRILVAAHHAGALEMLPLDDGFTGDRRTRTFRLLQVADVIDPTSALDAAEAASRTRLERDQLRRLALDAYSDLDDEEDGAGDVRQSFLERYFTDPSFLEDLRDARLDQDVCRNLDADQRLAVTAEHDRVALIAGAGTGKTRTLTRRIAYRGLVGGVLHDQMLAVCFGRDAANEMRERLAALGVHVAVRTLNSLGSGIIADYWPLLGYARKPEVVEQREQLEILRDAIRTLPNAAALLPNERRHLKDISRAKGALTSLDHMSSDDRDLFEAYERRMHRECRIDFDDQFVKALQVMDDPDAARHVRAAVKELFVDEAQDLNPAQWELLQSVGASARLTAVGDPRQAIYQFRGAEPGLFTEFAQSRGTLELPLRFNYRSVAGVVEAANKLVMNLSLPQLVPTIPAAGSVTVRAYAPESELVVTVRGWLQASIADDEIAVLVRSGVSQQRASSLLRSAGVGVRELGARPLHTTKAFELISRLLPGAHVAGGELTLVETLEDLFAREEVQRALENGATGGEEDPADDWYRVVAAISEHERNGTIDPVDVLSAVRTESLANRGHDTGVVVTTIYKAKGLEWKAVVVFDADADSFRDGEADRLLLYVALTRARTHLVVMSTTSLAPMAAHALL